MKLIMRLGGSGDDDSGPYGTLALVGRRGPMEGGSVEVALKRLPRGGRGVVTLPSGSGYERLTAVLVNADIAITRFSRDHERLDLGPRQRTGHRARVHRLRGASGARPLARAQSHERLDAAPGFASSSPSPSRWIPPPSGWSPRAAAGCPRA